MKFRIKMFSWHLSCSVLLLTMVLGGLYLGWYRWPGWYLANALRVVPILVCVDGCHEDPQRKRPEKRSILSKK